MLIAFFIIICDVRQGWFWCEVRCSCTWWNVVHAGRASVVGVVFYEVWGVLCGRSRVPTAPSSGILPSCDEGQSAVLVTQLPAAALHPSPSLPTSLSLCIFPLLWLGVELWKTARCSSLFSALQGLND